MDLERGSSVILAGRLAMGRVGRRVLRALTVAAGTSRGAGGLEVAEAPDFSRVSWAVLAKART
jgi:hypothetical protein